MFPHRCKLINVLSTYERRPILGLQENLYSQELATGGRVSRKASTQIIRIQGTITYVSAKKYKVL